MLTSPKNINKLKLKSTCNKTIKKTIKKSQEKLIRRKTNSKTVLSSSKQKTNAVDNNLSNLCVGCEENYESTLEKVDWIQCIRCKRWLHETCTI